MCPEIAHIGPFTIYSYGMMLSCSFIVAGIVLSRELKWRKIKYDLNYDIAYDITLLAAISGIVGAKILSAVENMDALLADPIGVLFTPGGLTFYGGLILAAIALYLYAKKKHLPIRKFMDSTAPSIVLAYGVGRVGCHLSGDGCYGIPTNLPWAMGYENGSVSTLSSENPMLVSLYKSIFHGSEVPTNILVHPTPIYELIYAVIIFGLLMVISRKLKLKDGILFGIFLIALGICRFLVETIRLNETIFFGLTEAQVISVGLVVGGIILAYYFQKTESSDQSISKKTIKKKRKSFS